jgi:hypothetical protein
MLSRVTGRRGKPIRFKIAYHPIANGPMNPTEVIANERPVSFPESKNKFIQKSYEKVEDIHRRKMRLPRGRTGL